MSEAAGPQAQTYFDTAHTAAVAIELGCGAAALFSTLSPKKLGTERKNEDAALVIDIDPQRCLLAVADGMGGCPQGGLAAKTALQVLSRSVRQGLSKGQELRHCIIDGFDAANQAVIELGVGAGTTLAVVTVRDAAMRSYHVGDTAVLLVGQRGKLKYQSISHSPVGYLQEAGALNEEEALSHQERHVISNALGDPDMKIEIGPHLEVAKKDRILLASDGLWDNLRTEEIIAVARKGPVQEAVAQLSAGCALRMANPEDGEPSKLDDLTVLMFGLG